MRIAGFSSADLLTGIQTRLFEHEWLALSLVWGTVAFAACFTYWQARGSKPGLSGFLRHCLPAGTLTHPSARADFLFWLSRRIFMPLFVLPLAISTVTAGYAAFGLLSLVFGPPTHAGPPGTALLCLFTLSMLLAYDLSYYTYHYVAHHVPLIWELHKVHHSAEVLVGVTKDRVHPLEELLDRWWDGMIPGLTYGIWLFFALDPVEVTVFGLSAYTIRGLLMMDVVRHTHLKMSYGKWLNQVFICPHYHQLHHSVDPRHYNKNFGLLFPIWDRMFGTLEVPAPGQDFSFGLANNEAADYQSLVRLHVLPVRNIYAMASDWLRRHAAVTKAGAALPQSDRAINGQSGPWAG
jgi:sterol desaturase/sphingolipid hydroxylase (fatty acid hydroxylase superfamily)